MVSFHAIKSRPAVLREALFFKAMVALKHNTLETVGPASGVRRQAKDGYHRGGNAETNSLGIRCAEEQEPFNPDLGQKPLVC